MITITLQSKTHKFKYYLTASLYLLFKWLTTRNKCYLNLIDLLLWYWKTGANEAQIKW